MNKKIESIDKGDALAKDLSALEVIAFALGLGAKELTPEELRGALELISATLATLAKESQSLTETIRGI